MVVRRTLGGLDVIGCVVSRSLVAHFNYAMSDTHGFVEVAYV